MGKALLECIVRLDLDKEFADDIGRLFTVFDDVLMVCLGSMKKSVNPVTKFMKYHHSMARVVLTMADVEVVLNTPKLEFHKCLDNVNRLVTASHTGNALFFPVARKGLEIYMRSLMRTTLENIDTPITKKGLAVANTEIHAELDRTHASKLLKGKRAIEVHYRADTFPESASTIEEDTCIYSEWLSRLKSFLQIDQLPKSNPGF